MQRLIILVAIMIAATGVKAQEIDKIHAEDGLLNHLSVGLTTGLTGTGVDVVMPVHKIVTVRAGFSGWGVGVKNQPFYFSAGLFIGSQNFIHFRNTNDGALGFLYDANQKVADYNRLYNTNYPPVGVKFGDYIFTADENGNIDVRMKTNAVKPYVGIGFGQHLAKKHRVSLAVDAGLLFWGTPKFRLNDETEIKASGKNSGIASALSWLKAWPNIQVRVAYKIF